MKVKLKPDAVYLTNIDSLPEGEIEVLDKKEAQFSSGPQTYYTVLNKKGVRLSMPARFFDVVEEPAAPAIGPATVTQVSQDPDEIGAQDFNKPRTLGRSFVAEKELRDAYKANLYASKLYTIRVFDEGRFTKKRTAFDHKGITYAVISLTRKPFTFAPEIIVSQVMDTPKKRLNFESVQLNPKGPKVLSNGPIMDAYNAAKAKGEVYSVSAEVNYLGFPRKATKQSYPAFDFGDKSFAVLQVNLKGGGPEGLVIWVGEILKEPVVPGPLVMSKGSGEDMVQAIVNHAAHEDGIRLYVYFLSPFAPNKYVYENNPDFIELGQMVSKYSEENNFILWSY